MIDLWLRIDHHDLSIGAKAIGNFALFIILTFLFLFVALLVLKVQLESPAILLVHVT